MAMRRLMEQARESRADRRATRQGGTSTQVFAAPIVLRNLEVSIVVQGALDKSSGVLSLKLGAYVTETGERLDVDVAELAGAGLERDRATGKLRIAEGTQVVVLGLTAGGSYSQTDTQAAYDKIDELIEVLTTMNVLNEETS